MLIMCAVFRKTILRAMGALLDRQSDMVRVIDSSRSPIITSTGAFTNDPTTHRGTPSRRTGVLVMKPPRTHSGPRRLRGVRTVMARLTYRPYDRHARRGGLRPSAVPPLCLLCSGNPFSATVIDYIMIAAGVTPGRKSLVPRRTVCCQAIQNPKSKICHAHQPPDPRDKSLSPPARP